VTLVAGGCSSAHHRRSADREVYGIVEQKHAQVFGRTNGFSIDTAYSHRDPKDIPPDEIIEERLARQRRLISLDEALRLAVANSRTYQLRKENLYLAGLSLTRERYEFSPQFFARGTATAERESDGEWRGDASPRVGVDHFLRSGGRLTAAIANDLVRYFSGDPRREATTVLTLNFVQPLLRGAGADVVAENLTQAERDVIYEIRSFSQFQRSFAVDIISTYYRILREKDTVRNNYNNYLLLVKSSERAQAQARDRLPPSQADQARQSELRSKRNYISSVRRYLDQLDDFKLNLGLPLGIEIDLEDSPLDDLRNVGLPAVPVSEEAAYRLAVDRQLELLNEIDRFEDSKRKIIVAANRLKTTLNFFANVTLESEAPTDYTRFDADDVRVVTGLTLDLPLDRLRERNDYRTTLIRFERQVRALSLALDSLRGNINEGLRALEESRRLYEIQLKELELANTRVERETLLVQAGRTEIRNLLEAQDAQIAAQNGVTQTLVNYHVARLVLLRDIGVLDINQENFWLKPQVLPPDRVRPDPRPESDQLITPEQLFGLK
jgi:outer membrane protein TolC